MDLNFRPCPKPNHKRRVKKRGDRTKFSNMVRDKVKEAFDNTCQECGGKGIHLHHVKFRSEGGKGVFTNALLLCNSCHKRIHLDNERAQYWKEAFKKKHGPLYFMDADDLKMKYLTQELHQEDKEVREWKKVNGEFEY
jgi:hypothetical protein